MEFKYNDGGRLQAGYKGSAGDCVCRAIAITTGKPYQEVYDYLAEKNSKQGRSKTAARGIKTRSKWFDEYMESLGFKWIPTMKFGQGCKTHLKKEELPNGKLIVNVSKHMVAVIDGVIHDTHDPSRNGTRCVYGYYKLD